MLNFLVFSRKSNQFLDGARSWNMAYLQRDHSTKGKDPKSGKFCQGFSEMGDGIFSV
jgi:hypothetical protein